MLDAVDLPDHIAALKAMLIRSQLREVRKDKRIERLEKLVATLKQAAFGGKSEKANPEQLDLALEELEAAIAAVHAEDEADSAPGKPRPKSRTANRGSLPGHLPRVEEIIQRESLICTCGGGLRCIGEDVSERMDLIPAQFRVIDARRLGRPGGIRAASGLRRSDRKPEAVDQAVHGRDPCASPRSWLP